MEEETIEFYDESEDRKYFTIIPNFILNHSTAIDQAVYIQIKKHAGERGECFVSEKTLMKKLGVGRHLLHKSLDYLNRNNWIILNGYKTIKTSGGEQKVKSYRVIDIWRTNVEFYEGVSKLTPQEQRGAKNDIKGVLIQRTKKNPINNIQGENSSIKYLEKIPDNDLEEFYNRFDTSKSKIQDKAESLLLYCKSKGKTYKDYRAFLLNALKKDFSVRKIVKVVRQEENNNELIKIPEDIRSQIKSIIK